jgi:hypothetical protein
MSPRKTYTFYIDDDLIDALKRVKARDGVPEAEQIRRAIREALERRGEMKAERKRASTRKRS